MTRSQPTPGELRQLISDAPSSDQWQTFLAMSHAPAEDHVDSDRAHSYLVGEAPAGRRICRVGMWLAIVAAVTGMIALTIWSVGKITTGISETPRPAPLPAAPFNYTPTAPPAAGGSTAVAVAGGSGSVASAGGGLGGAGGVGSAPTTTRPTSTNVAGTAAVPAGPRVQTPVTPLTGDQLAIPALGVTAAVITEHIQTSTSGSELVIPGDVSQVGWWDGSAPLTATTGSVLIAGHIDNRDQGPGALHDLYQAQAGDLIYLTRGGVSSRWKVVALQIFPKDAAHPDWFAGATGPRELHLVTCGGPLLTEANGSHTYADNVAVTAIPA